MAIQRKRVQLTKKKRKWYSIHAPKEYGSVQLGESLVSDPKNLIGKTIKTDLSVVSKSRSSNTRVVFRVKNLVDDKGICELIGYYLLPNYIKKYVRKNKTKIDASYKLKSKDGAECVIKILMVSRSKLKSGLAKQLRSDLDALVKSEFSKKTFDQILNGVISYHFQKSSKALLSKVYPLNSFEVRVLSKK
jgi:small subunit ribosomal protein S3Ae